MNTSLLQRQVTQFDTNRAQASIATPTCSSCCCCCCCLGTAVASTAALGIDVHKITPKKTKPSAKNLAKIYAVAAIPVTVIFWMLANGIFPELASSLMSLSFSAIPIVLLPLFGMIFLAYHTAKIPKVGTRALSATSIIAGCLLAEGFLGMMLLFMGGGGGVLYLIGAAAIAIGVPTAMAGKGGKRKKTKKDTSNYDTW